MMPVVGLCKMICSLYPAVLVGTFLRDSFPERIVLMYMGLTFFISYIVMSIMFWYKNKNIDDEPCDFPVVR